MNSQHGLYDIVKYPVYTDIQKCIGHKITIINRHKPGLCVKTHINEDYTTIVGDWYGNSLTAYDHNLQRALEINDSIIPFMSTIGLKFYQIFFDDMFKITDLVDDKYNYASPSMIQMIFSDKFEIQTIKSTSIFGHISSIDNLCSSGDIVKVCDMIRSEPIYAKIL